MMAAAGGAVQGRIQPGPRCPPGLCRGPTRKAGQKTASSAWDDLFRHAAPARFAASFPVFYCLRPGPPPSAVQHPALSTALRRRRARPDPRAGRTPARGGRASARTDGRSGRGGRGRPGLRVGNDARPRGAGRDGAPPHRTASPRLRGGRISAANGERPRAFPASVRPQAAPNRRAGSANRSASPTQKRYSEEATGTPRRRSPAARHGSGSAALPIAPRTAALTAPCPLPAARAPPGPPARSAAPHGAERGAEGAS